MPPTPEQVRDCVETYAKTFTAGDRQGWLDCFTDEAVVHDPVTAPPNVGKEAIAGFWDNVHALAETITLEVHHIHVCGEEAAMVFTITTASGPMKMTIEAVDVFRIDDAGLITQQRAYWDPGAMTVVEG